MISFSLIQIKVGPIRGGEKQRAKRDDRDVLARRLEKIAGRPVWGVNRSLKKVFTG